MIDSYGSKIQIHRIGPLKVGKIDFSRKPLEQETCKDCISREKAKQFLYERLDRLNDDELYDIFSRIIDDMYNELPFVEQEPKQEPTLNKIRAEIDKLPDLNPDYEMDKTIYVSKWAVFNIIDKYKAESEEV